MTFTLWFMGRPAAGKSTIAKRTESRLREQDYRLENLDGDELRKNLHPDLGFSKEDRALNNRRTAYISKLLNRNGINVIVGMITPFHDSQAEARRIIQETGDFVLIYVKCSVETAEQRDPKNMYQQAKKGKIEKFTGINHPFEEPHNPEIIVNTESQTEAECVETVLERLHELEYLDDEPSGDYEFDISRSEEESIKDRLRRLGYIDD
jgi:adenylylsulfate kinase